MKPNLLKTISLPTAVLALDATADGRTLLAGCHDGVYDVNVESGASVKLGAHESYVSGVALLREETILVTAGYDGALIWWDLATRQPLRKVPAHDFWSWQLARSPDGKLLASVTGQFLAGGYKYEPAPEREPSVKVFEAQTGALVRALPQVPPVLSVAFSADSQHLAAANLMGEVRVWKVSSGTQLAQWNTPSFTSWGLIKSHHYCGGIFALAFTQDDNELLLAGMGPMNDPMAGNGKQTWERFAWRQSPPKKTAEIREGDAGRGLMESLAFHPNGQQFVMAGRLTQGTWNVAIFNSDGALAHSFDTKSRVTHALFRNEGKALLLSGAVGQGKPQNGKSPDYGRVFVYALS